jgi:hypothetical protein
MNTNDYKINKYVNKFYNCETNKKNIYLKKLLKCCNIQSGGNILHISKDMMINYINQKIGNKTKAKDKDKKFFVLLYGPPASGKTTARKIACQKIYQMYGGYTSVDELYNTFVDTSVDDIVGDIMQDNDLQTTKNLQTVFYHTLEKYFTENPIELQNSNITLDIWLTNDMIKDKTTYIMSNKTLLNLLATNSFEAYNKNRKSADAISDLVRDASFFLGLNVFVESASYDEKYWRGVFELVKYYGYTPIIIYPYTKNFVEIQRRNIARGLTSYRILNNDGPYGITQKMEECSKSFNLLFNDLQHIFESYDKMILIYDTSFSRELYGLYKNPNYDSNENQHAKLINFIYIYLTQNKELDENVHENFHNVDGNVYSNINKKYTKIYELGTTKNIEITSL